jgi:hypothetical protein
MHANMTHTRFDREEESDEVRDAQYIKKNSVLQKAAC